MTRGIAEAVRESNDFSLFMTESLLRYCKKDWGDICSKDKQMNDSAVKNDDDRIVARYNSSSQGDIYIMTEWDRSYTTILFVSEY